MNYWILCSLLVLERYYSAGKHRLSLGCRAMSLQQRRQCLSSTWDGCGEICVFAHAFIAFLGYFWFWMGDIEVARWKGVDFLVPKHLRKSKIGLLEQIWAKNPYVTFFLDHPVYVKENLFWLLMVDQWTANAMVNNNWPLLQKGRERLMRGVSGNTTASICIQSFLFRVFTLLHPFTFPSSSASASLSVFATYLR